jgi:hypothetical protein
LKTRPAAEVNDIVHQIQSGETLQNTLQRIECGDTLSQLGKVRQSRYEVGIPGSNGAVPQKRSFEGSPGSGPR